MPKRPPRSVRDSSSGRWKVWTCRSRRRGPRPGKSRITRWRRSRHMSTMHMLGEPAQGEQNGAPEEAVAEVFTWTFPGAPVSIQLDAGIISRLAEDAGTGGIL